MTNQGKPVSSVNQGEHGWGETTTSKHKKKKKKKKKRKPIGSPDKEGKKKTPQGRQTSKSLVLKRGQTSIKRDSGKGTVFKGIFYAFRGQGGKRKRPKSE